MNFSARKMIPLEVKTDKQMVIVSNKSKTEQVHLGDDIKNVLKFSK
jgi:hypothetical protein